MTRHERFVLAVQTAAIVRDLNESRVIAHQAVLDATLLDECVLPKDIDLDHVVGEFLDWEYGQQATRPSWLEPAIPS